MSGVIRDPNRLVPRLREAVQYVVAEYPRRWPADPRPLVSETHRTAAVQRAYYAQGRRPIGEVNKLRNAAGLARIDEAANRRKITQRKPGSSKHEADPAQAFDLAFRNDDGTLNWDAKFFARAARIIRERYPDVVWGGDWDSDGRSDDERFIDRPHFEI